MVGVGTGEAGSLLSMAGLGEWVGKFPYNTCAGAWGARFITDGTMLDC